MEQNNHLIKPLIGLIIICVAIIGFLLIYGFSLLIHETTPSQESVGVDISSTESPIYYNTSTESFLKLAKDFASSHKANKTYNCVDYAHDFAKIAEDDGYYVIRVAGCNFDWMNRSNAPKGNNMCHQWIQYYDENLTMRELEPQLGTFLNISKTYRYPMMPE